MALNLAIVTPEADVLQIECDEVAVPGTNGEIGILPGHWDHLSVLAPGGVVDIRHDETKTLAAVHGGFLLVHEGSYDWQFWLVFALVVWIASFLTGAGFLGPESGRIQKTINEKGIESDEAQARIRRIFLVSRIELILLILVVLDMTLKPGS